MPKHNIENLPQPRKGYFGEWCWYNVLLIDYDDGASSCASMPTCVCVWFGEGGVGVGVELGVGGEWGCRGVDVG